MTTEPAASVQSGLRRYARLWLGVPRELLALIAGFVLSAVAFTLVIGLVSAAVGTIVTFFIGVLFLVAAFYVARFAGTAEVRLVEFAGRPAIPRPDWRDAEARSGFFGWLKSLVTNPHDWLALLHSLLHFVLAVATFTVATTWTGIGLGGITSWLWLPLVPAGERDARLGVWIAEHWFGLSGGSGLAIGIAVHVVLGIVFLVTLPFVTRGLTWAHWGLDRALLGTFRTEQLEREVATLAESRSAAVAAEGAALRRLERDIHDGPQQRLVRLQMDLAAAERQLESDPDAARALLAEARRQSREALDELRALSRGFAPPILLDRGLVAALESLAVRSATAVLVEPELPEGTALPTELERNAYFIAAEAVTNAVKHADARSVRVRLALRSGAEGRTLEVTVADDGRGGAVAVPGHGIAGLEERARGLGGTLEVSSPAGEGTTVVARLPVEGRPPVE